ncbi:MAG: apolipoprotein N-acyltransferase, partial [Blastocatellia bacterium]
GTCWWLTYAPITYAAFPPILAYSLLFVVCSIVGIFPGIFSAILSVLLRRFGSIAILAAPFVWVFTEFLRYWLTGNNWNAIGYSLALANPTSALSFMFSTGVVGAASLGGTGLVGFFITVSNSVLVLSLVSRKWPSVVTSAMALIVLGLLSFTTFIGRFPDFDVVPAAKASMIGVQPNVPMSGLDQAKWRQLRQLHVELAESALQKLTTDNRPPTTVIFPESPMNFAYNDDLEFQTFIHAFARRNNVNVLFNSAEPNHADGKFFNSAVLVGPEGREIAQYDKIYLVPFGESVPAPLQSIVPAFVGSFSYGNEYDLFPLGDAKAGVMICFESHFGQLSREYVLNGADVIIEMTNDGYLGPTPVLRQHLANAVFRAVETNRPVLRVTNVGITAYINERGEVLDALPMYQEGTRIWSVSKSDGSQTFYVKYGDWFAWLCSAVTAGLLVFGFMRKRQRSEPPA